MGNIILPNSATNGHDIWVNLNIPNQKLLTEPWRIVAWHILRPKSMRSFVKNVIRMATALGDINKNYSKNLPDKYLIELQRRMTELRKVVKNAEQFKKKEIIPWQQLEYLFSGGDRKDMKRDA